MNETIRLRREKAGPWADFRQRMFWGCVAAALILLYTLIFKG